LVLPSETPGKKEGAGGDRILRPVSVLSANTRERIGKNLGGGENNPGDSSTRKLYREGRGEPERARDLPVRRLCSSVSKKDYQEENRLRVVLGRGETQRKSKEETAGETGR